MPFYPDHLKVDDPDTIDIPLMGIAVADTTYTHPMHQHHKGQLLFCNQGIVEVITRARYFLLSPARAVWIPPGTPHKINSRTPFSFQSLYFDTKHFERLCDPAGSCNPARSRDAALPATVRTLRVSTLLRELIAKACTFDFSYTVASSEYRLAVVIVDEINAALGEVCSIAMPCDPRLKKALVYLKKNPGLQATATLVAQHLHVTPRTLSRLCQKELGYSFEHWRAQIMMMESLVLLEGGRALGYVSQKLGYGSDSAFIHSFKQWTDTTPHVYKTHSAPTASSFANPI